MYMATQSITFCVPHLEGFAAACGAATSVFNLIEREPGIDSLYEGGSSPRRVIGNIALENVHFSYPSRPNVKVGKVSEPFFRFKNIIFKLLCLTITYILYRFCMDLH